MDLVVSSKLKDYKKRYSIDNNTSEGIAFERFANHTIVSIHQPDNIDSDSELLDLICVGGQNDMGIDGIAIKFNGNFVKNIAQIDELIELNQSNSATAEFIFIQSKYNGEFISGDYGKFCDGIADFVNDIHYEPHNDKIENWIKIKDYLFSNDLFDKLSWSDNPIVRVYYISMGTWNDSKHIEAKFNRLKDDILRQSIFGEVIPHFIDCESFKKLRSDLENAYTVSITTNGELQLTDVEKIKKSSIFLCMAEDYIPLLKNPEGNIRKSIFFDNVRDFQGMTSINNEVLDTINEKPSSFVLLNNGITIICDSFEQQNRRIKIINPQIVNGCQTSNLLFEAYRQGKDISNVSISIKLIETSDPEIINDIVRGTNKQNIVYDAAFETTKPFHKELEKFFEAAASEETIDSEKIYYERRSKQFFDNHNIKQYQRVNIRTLIQSYASIFLKTPHVGHRHESILLKKYENTIFVKGQSLYQYFIAALLHTKLELYFINNPQLKKKYYPYKNQLLCIVMEKLPGVRPNINNRKQMDDYCKMLHCLLKEPTVFEDRFTKAIGIFDDLENAWVLEKGLSFQHGIKDSEEFTIFALKRLNDSMPICNIENVGPIIRVHRDKNDRLYCFIKREPENIFAHSADNPDVNFSELQPDELVTYDIEKDRYGTGKAVSMKLVENG